MFSIRPLPEFNAWLDGLKDEELRGVIVARIKRLERGLMGDVQPVGEGVSELRIHLGAGWRLYFTRRGTQLIVLLVEARSERRKRTSNGPKRWPRHWTERGEIMSKRIKVADLPEFDAAHYLDSETALAAYLTDILQANDAALLASALGDIARARGMTEIAKTAGITREALYKALRPDSAPRFDTVSRVCAALGVRLVAQPVHPASEGVGL
jgi:probable addiction module antidote protein/putative addiction module killer protein